MARISRISTLLSFPLLASVVPRTLALEVQQPLGWPGSLDVPSAVECISKISELDIFTPSTSGYNWASQPFNFRIATSPAVVVIPKLVQQIQDVVKCAASAKVNVTAKSGGHSYGAYGLAGDVVIDMMHINNLTLNGTGAAVVQTGNRLGSVAQGIFNNGNRRALPHGSCPYVGSGGHTLYGGFGYYGRIGGLMVDAVVGVELVLANGSLVTANSTLNQDLFWAVRGGGPSFGIVTAWTFQTVLAPSKTVNYNITFPNRLSISELVDSYIAWEKFAKTNASQALAMATLFVPVRGNNSTVDMSFVGNYYGNEADFRNEISKFNETLPPTARAKAQLKSSGELGWIEGLIVLAGNDGTLNVTKPPPS